MSPMREFVAEAIYNVGPHTVKWTPGSPSDAQNKAREYAQAAIEAVYSYNFDYPMGAHYTIKHDGFTGTVVGHYIRHDGYNGIVLQLDGANVVHNYGVKYLNKPDWVVSISPDYSGNRSHLSPENIDKVEQKMETAKLGLATNAEIIGELSARYNFGHTHPDYSTVSGMPVVTPTEALQELHAKEQASVASGSASVGPGQAHIYPPRGIVDQSTPECLEAFVNRYSKMFDLSPYVSDWGNTRRFKHENIQSLWDGFVAAWNLNMKRDTERVSEITKLKDALESSHEANKELRNSLEYFVYRHHQ